jgi:hypothetical protein
MAAMNTIHKFTVARVDRRGEWAPTYLRAFAPTGRNGLKQLAFGERAEAYVFEGRAEAEDVARRLRRRVSATDYDYQVVEVAEETALSP